MTEQRSEDPIQKLKDRPTFDVGLEAQRAAGLHMAAVWDAYYEEEDGVDPDDQLDQPARPESPSFAPFCGCDTCSIREVLAGAWPVIEGYFVSLGAKLPADQPPAWRSPALGPDPDVALAVNPVLRQDATDAPR